MVWSFKKTDSLPQQQLILWESLLEKRTGLQLTEAQHILLQTQISIRMRELDLDDYQQYYDIVKDERSGVAEWQVLVDRLVVKETSFFRHRPSLDLVKKCLESHLVDSLQAKDSFEIWSVGCSTGEEPYALSAIAHECFEAADLSPYYGVTGVDISLPALSIARKGIYSRRSLNLLSDAELKRYFVAKENNQYQVIDKIKQRVCFAQLNVLHLEYKPIQPMDIIFCQNMLIYFRRWRRREILKGMVKHLKPGGLLVIGLGEVTDWQHDDMRPFKSENIHAYQKIKH